MRPTGNQSKVWSSPKPSRWIRGWIVSGFSLITSGIVLGGCSDPPEPPAASPSPSASASQGLSYENITLTQVSQQGKPQWKITANQALYNSQQTGATLKTVGGEFYDAQGHPIRIQASGGSVSMDQTRLTLDGKISAEFLAYGLKLEAGQVEWLPNQNSLTARKQVVISQSSPAPVQVTPPATPSATPAPRLMMRADQMTGDLTLNRILLSNIAPSGQTALPVTASSRDPQLDLQAQQLELDIPTQILTASTRVVLVASNPKLSLTGSRLIATPTRITLSGSVYAQGPNGVELWANQLVWAVNSTEVQAEGNVRYRNPRQNLTLNGSKGVVNWRTQTAKLFGGTTLTTIDP